MWVAVSLERRCAYDRCTDGIYLYLEDICLQSCLVTRILCCLEPCTTIDTCQYRIDYLANSANFVLCSRSLKPGPIHGLPVELLYNFLEPLDYDSIRACTLVCREWRMVSQRLLYKAPRLSGYESLDTFFEIVTNNPHLGDAARDLHILGKANYSSMRPTPWILDVPSRLVTLLPNVRSITFDQVEHVLFDQQFWTELKKFEKVTSLTFKASRFYSETDIENIILIFPKLKSLTLSNVHWEFRRRDDDLPDPRWHQLLSLETLRLNNVPGRAEYETLFRWLWAPKTVRKLEVLQCSYEAFDLLGYYLHHLADKRGSLDSFSFSPTVAVGREEFGTWVR